MKSSRHRRIFEGSCVHIVVQYNTYVLLLITPMRPCKTAGTFAAALVAAGSAAAGVPASPPAAGAGVAAGASPVAAGASAAADVAAGGGGGGAPPPSPPAASSATGTKAAFERGISPTSPPTTSVPSPLFPEAVALLAYWRICCSLALGVDVSIVEV